MTTIITTSEELEALPIGSLVKARWFNGSKPEYLSMRIPEGNVSYGGYGMSGGRYWSNMIAWDAELTLLFRAPETN